MAGNYKYCKDCGTKLPADAKFCTSCGEKQVTNKTKQKVEPTPKRVAEDEKGNSAVSRIIAFCVVFAAIAGIIAIALLSNVKPDYYSGKYTEDLAWYMKTCADVFKDSYTSTTLVFCDCGYYEFRNKYGNRKIYGELSVSDVLGIGVDLDKTDDRKPINDDELSDKIKQCYDSEIEKYKKEHPNTDIDQLWNDDQNFIVPHRLLDKEDTWSD